MEESIVSLRAATEFSISDVNCAYWQVEVEKANRDKTIFTSRHLLYHFVQMHLGFANARETIQHAMDVILAPVQRQFSQVYLDDFVFFRVHHAIKLSLGRELCNFYEMMRIP